MLRDHIGHHHFAKVRVMYKTSSQTSAQNEHVQCRPCRRAPQHCSTKRKNCARENASLNTRQEGLLTLPCRTALDKYIGTSAGEVGLSSLVRERLEAELLSLSTPQSKVCTLIVNEMHIRQRYDYHKQRDEFIGDVSLGEVDNVVGEAASTDLANSLLCFLLCGLSVNFRIPVGYFFTHPCSGPSWLR